MSAVRPDDIEQTTKRAKTETGSASTGNQAISNAAVDDVPEYGLSLDVEMAGPELNRELLAIGAVFGKKDGTIIKQAAFCSRVPSPLEFNQLTWSEFWVKHQSILMRIDSAATDNPIQEFNNWVLDLEKQYGPFGRKHKQKVRFNLITDNPGCDIGRINVALMLKVDPKHPGLAEMFDDYVSTDDPTEQIKGMHPQQVRDANQFVTAPHDHWPVNDATETFQLWCGVKRVLGE